MESEMCGKFLMNTTSRMDIDTREKPFACTFCEKTIAYEGHIKMYPLVHTDKPHSCQVCKKTFATKKTFSQPHR